MWEFIHYIVHTLDYINNKTLIDEHTLLQDKKHLVHQYRCSDLINGLLFYEWFRVVIDVIL